MPIGLREELTTWKARTPHSGGNQPVILSGRPRGGETPQAVRNAKALHKTAIKTANVELAKLGIEPISESVPRIRCAYLRLDASSPTRRLGLHRRTARAPRRCLHSQHLSAGN